MCTGLEIAALIGAGASTAGTIHQANQSKPQPALQNQPAKAPTEPTRTPQRKPRGAYGTPQLLSAPLTGSTTLLGR